MAKFVHGVYPILISIGLTFIGYQIGFTHKVANFDKVLDGSVIFSSIVVGFLAALLGILVSIRNTEIVKAIFDSQSKWTLKYYFYEAILLGFIVVFVSSAMHVMRGEETIISNVTFYAWNIVVFWFAPSTFRIVNVLMSIFFRTNASNSRPESNKVSPEEESEIKKRLSKQARKEQ